MLYIGHLTFQSSVDLILLGFLPSAALGCPATASPPTALSIDGDERTSVFLRALKLCMRHEDVVGVVRVLGATQYALLLPRRAPRRAWTLARLVDGSTPWLPPLADMCANERLPHAEASPTPAHGSYRHVPLGGRAHSAWPGAACGAPAPALDVRALQAQFTRLYAALAADELLQRQTALDVARALLSDARQRRAAAHAAAVEALLPAVINFN